MRIERFLRISENGSVDLIKSDSFQVGPEQVALRLVIELDDEAFAPKSIPTVMIRVPTDMLIRNIDAKVIGEKP